MHLQWIILWIISGLVCCFTSSTTSTGGLDENSWYQGCHSLSTRLPEGQENSTLTQLLEESLLLNVSKYYESYNLEESQPLYGSSYCSNVRLPFIVIVNLTRFYCVEDIGLLDRVSNDSLCDERCSGDLPCGSSEDNLQQYASVYLSSNTPRLQAISIIEPSKLYTSRNLTFTTTIQVTRSFGLESDPDEPLTPVPVYCRFHENNVYTAQVQASQDNSAPGASHVTGHVTPESSDIGDVTLVVCIYERRYAQELNLTLSVEVITAWETRRDTLNVTVTHEYPALPDIQASVPDYDRPSCVPPSTNQLMSSTDHQATVQVYAGVPIPFLASVGQGMNMTFYWRFDSDDLITDVINQQTCSSSCKQSTQIYSYNTTGVHHISVNFTNLYGFISSSLRVIVVSREILGAVVNPSINKYAVGFYSQVSLDIEVTTSLRYFTYIHVDMGDGVSMFDWALIDQNVWDNERPEISYPDSDVISVSYMTGCVLRISRLISYSTLPLTEGIYTVSWSVSNNVSSVSGTLPQPFRVYKSVERPRLEGQLSYVLGSDISVRAVWDSDSDQSYNRTVRWELREFINNDILYSTNGTRGDVFTYTANITGQYSVTCLVWNELNEYQPVEESITILITESLGDLHVDTSQNIITAETHSVLRFTASLDSGLGARFIWNSTSTHKSIAHIDNTVDQLNSTADITFIKPDTYTVTVFAKVGATSTPVKFVRMVEVYERITHVTCSTPHSNPSGCGLTAHIKTGSNVNMVFHFPNSSMTSITRRVDGNQTTVQPSPCPSPGAHSVLVTASNDISSLEVMCHIVVLPSYRYITAQLTAAYDLQLEAIVTSHTGRVDPLNAVYIWNYDHNGPKTKISALPFTMLTDLVPGTSVSASVEVHGLRGGVRREPAMNYQHRFSFLQHDNVVRPLTNTDITIRNVYNFGFTEIDLSVFGTHNTFNLTAVSEPTYTTTSGNASVSYVTLDAGGDTISSKIASVLQLPPEENVTLTCPTRVIASRESQTLISVELGADYESYYAYYSWYKNGVHQAYTAIPSMFYEFTDSIQYNITVEVVNHWSNFTKMCQIICTQPLMDMEVRPTMVQPLSERTLMTSYLGRPLQATTITVLFYGGVSAINNLTVDFGDDSVLTYTADQVQGLAWLHINNYESKLTFNHSYYEDKQYRVFITASTEQTTLNSSAIVYRSISGMTDNRLEIGQAYEHRDVVYETQDVSVRVKTGDYIKFEWSVGNQPITVLESSDRYSKVRVTFRYMGEADITVRISNPGSADGILVNLGHVYIQTKPLEGRGSIFAKIDNKLTTTTRLENGPQEVEFGVDYEPGPDNADVYWTFSDDPPGATPGISRSLCQDLFIKTLCTATITHTFSHVGVYTVTAEVSTHFTPPFRQSMQFEVLPLRTRMRFVNFTRLDLLDQTPVYHFHINDQAAIPAYLQSADPLQGNITYRWQFGDGSVDSTYSIPSTVTNIATHQYMSMKEAGFTVTVTAITGNGTEIQGTARAIVYKSITRVSVSVNDEVYTEQNEGNIYFVDLDVVDRQLLFKIHVYPDNVPFEICHLVHSVTSTRDHISSSPTIRKSYLPENTHIPMYALMDAFSSRQGQNKYVTSVKVYALCSEVRVGGDDEGNIIKSETVTVSTRPKIINVYISRNTEAEGLERNEDRPISVGYTYVYQCVSGSSGVFKFYVNGEVNLDSSGSDQLEFQPEIGGVYNITCLADNAVSQGSATILVSVVDFWCNLDLQIRHKNTLGSSWSPHVWHRSDTITLKSAKAFKHCLKFTKVWALKWGISQQLSDGAEVDVPISNTVITEDDLYLPPRTLQPGDYTVTVNASIPGIDYVKTATALLRVTRTPIKAIISTGLGLKINFADDQLITLSGSSSYDPDCPDCELQYIWSCYFIYHKDQPCFTNSTSKEFAFTAQAEVNTSSLVFRPAADRVYQIVLVVKNGDDYALTNQVWEPADSQASRGSEVQRLSVAAVCESCTDGPKLRASPHRPVVFRGGCPEPLTDCSNVRYRWKVELVPKFSNPTPGSQYFCNPRTAYEFTTTTTTTPAYTTTSTTTTTTTTTPPPIIPEGGGLIIPTEGGTMPFPFPIEEGGSGGGGSGGSGGSTTTTAPNFRWPEDLVSPTSRRPVPTTTLPTTTLSPESLAGCGCALEDDDTPNTHPPGLYTSDRFDIENFESLNGLNERDLIIAADVLEEQSAYVVTLEVRTEDQIIHAYYPLNTSSTPSRAECVLSWFDRWPNGAQHYLFSLVNTAGTEMEMEYSVTCTVKSSDDSNKDDRYFYWFETYIERVPGHLELVSRKVDESSFNNLGQRLPAGFEQYQYQVNFYTYVVDVYGTRKLVCNKDINPRLKHKILPRPFSDNETGSDYVYGLVSPPEPTAGSASSVGSADVDWYNAEMSLGDVFYTRTSMLGLSDILNRVSILETDEHEVVSRRHSRERLLRQLSSSPHRYMAEVEQKLNVLRSIVEIRSELYPNATVLAADMLYNLTEAFAQFSKSVQPFNVSSLSDTVFRIGSQLISLSRSSGHGHDIVNKLDHSISTLLSMSLNSDYLNTDRNLTRSVNGMSLLVNRYSSIRDETIVHGNVSFSVPASFVHGLGTRTKECYSSHMLQYPDNPYKPGVNSTVSALTLYDCEGREITDTTTTDSGSYVRFSLPLAEQQDQIFSEFSLRKADMNIHEIEIPATRGQGEGRALSIVIRPTIVDGHTFPIAVLIRKNSEPKPHAGDYDRKVYVHTKDTQVEFFFDSADLYSTSKLYISLSDVNFNEGRPRDREITRRDYSLLTYWSECVYWDKLASDWSSQGCNVTRETSLTFTHCSCSHLTAFSSRRNVVSIKLDKKRVEDYFVTKHYPTTTVLVALSVLIYMILAIVSYIADTKSPVQEKVIAIQDNSPSDRQRYIITIETGSEPGCGTTSKVSLVLHGEVGMSETRELIAPTDSDTNVFQTNSRDTFLLTLPSSLGPIWKVQLWHNNKGGSPGWYVKRVTVRDVDNGQSYYFLCESWLAVEESDGKVEREFMALDSHIGFGVVFKVKGPQYFNDYHLLRSLIYKPTYSHFSRVERLTCLWVGLLSHMALCTLYYWKEVEEYRGQANLYDLSSKTVLVSLGVNLIACPLMLLLSMIFRRSKVGGRQALKAKESKKHKLASKSGDGINMIPPHPGGGHEHTLHGSQSLLEQSILHWQSLQEWAQKQWEKRYQKALLAGEELTDIEMQMQEQVLTLASTQSGGMFFNRTDQTKIGSQSDVKHLIPKAHTDDSESVVTSSNSSLSDDTFVRTRRFYLPPSFRYLAWLLSFVFGFGSGFVTVYYSKDFQEGRYALWLQSIFVTFLFCNFIIQPLGILFKAIGTAIVYRRDPTVLQHFPDRYEEDIEEIRQRFTHLTDEDEITRGTRARQRSRYLRFARPPQEKQLIAARKRTMKEKKFLKLAGECGIIVLLLLILSVIIFSCEREKAYQINSNIRRIIATTPVTARHQSFSNITKPAEMWEWLERDLTEIIFTNHSQNLGSSVIIGNATKFEQVRVHAEDCVAEKRMPEWTLRDVCYPAYSFYTADKETLRLDNNTVEYYQASINEDAVLYGNLFDYHESGFRVLMPTKSSEFVSSLSSLRWSGWLDKKTRMIFIEFTVYNIPTNLYSSVTAMFEFTATGQVLPSLLVDSAKLYRYRGSWDFVVLTAEMMFVMVYLCQAHFYVIIIMQLRKKYFSQIWNILDCFYLLIALTYIIIFIYRHAIVKMLHEELTEAFHSEFVSVAPLIYWDTILRALIGLLLFIVVVRILKLFRYIKTFARIGNVYRRAARDIRAFAMFFLLLIIIYTNLGVALFQSVSVNFSGYWRGVMTVAGHLTGAGSYEDYREMMPILGGAYTVLISVSGQGLLIALMVAILSYHFRDFRQERILAMNMKEAFRFLRKRFQRKIRKKREQEEDDSNSQVLSPEFALAEMEYQVDELLFKMSALCDGVSLPNKSSIYYTTDSDGTLGGVGAAADDMLSSGGSNPNDKELDENSLTRLLHLQGIGTQIHDGDQTYRSQLEMEVLRHLQMSNPRDNVALWDELRRTDRALSDEVTSENDIPIHREEYSNPVFHAYEGGQSGDEDDAESFISIPDESHVPLQPYCPTPPPKRNKKRDKEARNKHKHSAQAEVYELREQSAPPRPLSPEIAYHNDAFVSDVEVELDLEFTPSPVRIGGFHKKSRSKTNKSQSAAYQNQGYHDDDEGGNSQQTNV